MADTSKASYKVPINQPIIQKNGTDENRGAMPRYHLILGNLSIETRGAVTAEYGFVFLDVAGFVCGCCVLELLV